DYFCSSYVSDNTYIF
nr:immunoglobulin light chain junction region [Macaca mulatta]MOW15577.1 immunoglobulin light chain junction region [Macaca mulatta]MOW16422.1 immunoglobulin light chain junction region [Macaca mulatta]MOW17714.1 immunoglobulin light chain junction region [Macaca mulatta]MOW17980.1 immunoglobulin light chain junction region [Macaca mulatta]